MAGESLFVRIQGKVHGPFAMLQLVQLRDRGRLHRFHEVSADRLNWAPASTLAGLFPPEPARGEPVVTVVPTAASPVFTAAPVTTTFATSSPLTGGGEWYYTDPAGQQQGPIPQAELEALWQHGKLLETALVWKDGMPDWRPLIEVFASPAAVHAPASSRQEVAPLGPGAALLRFVTDPVGGLPVLARTWGAAGSLGLGIAFALVFDVCVLLYVVWLTSSLPGTLLSVPDVGEAGSKLEFVIKSFFVLLLFPLCMGAGVTLARLVTRGEGNFGADLLSGTAACLPLGLYVPVAVLLGPANGEAVAFLALVAIVLAILILNSAFTRIVGLSDRGAALAVPATVVASSWLFKIVVSAVFSPPLGSVI